MSTPITFSGYNNIDFNTVVNALMQQASVPLTSLETQQKNLQSQASKYDTLLGCRGAQISSRRSGPAELAHARLRRVVRAAVGRDFHWNRRNPGAIRRHRQRAGARAADDLGVNGA